MRKNKKKIEITINGPKGAVINFMYRMKQWAENFTYFGERIETEFVIVEVEQ